MLPAPSALAALLPGNARLDRAFQDVVRIADPAKAGQLRLDVEDGYFYYLLHLFGLYLCSAAVGNRAPQLLILDHDQATVAVAPINGVLTASQTLLLTWDAGGSGGYLAAGNGAVSPVPPVVALPGWSYRLNSSGFGGNDQLTSFSAVVLKIPTGPQAEPSPRPADTRHAIAG